MLIQTAASLHVVEIKRQARIGREVIDEVKEKCRRLPRARGLSVRTALVYSGELAKSVESEGFFDAVVPFARLIGLC